MIQTQLTQPQSARTERSADQASTTQPSSAQLPSQDFTSHFVVANGDSLFQSAFMALTDQPGVHGTPEQVMELREGAAQYISENHEALIDSPFFGDVDDVNDLYGLLLTQGAWDEGADDIAAPLLAQISGREVVVLQQEQGNDDYTIQQTFPPENPELPAATPSTGQPPIFLKQTNDGHYEFLEPRQTQLTNNSALSERPSIDENKPNKGKNQRPIGQQNQQLKNEQLQSLNNTTLLSKQRQQLNNLNLQNTLTNNQIQNMAALDAQIGYTANSVYDTGAKVLADQQNKAKGVAEAFKN